VSLFGIAVYFSCCVEFASTSAGLEVKKNIGVFYFYVISFIQIIVALHRFNVTLCNNVRRVYTTVVLGEPEHSATEIVDSSDAAVEHKVVNSSLS
jgi:hypothetical protein